MIDISKARASSSPDLPNSLINHMEKTDHNTSNMEGVATNVMVLLKLIHDHNEASGKDDDDRKAQRVAGMMTILDDVKTRIQKSQTVGNRRAAELRRCNTDLRRGNNIPKDKRSSMIEPMDEKEKLRKELSANLAARKSLEIMCSSVGKEKEIIATELARKVHELNGMEELINDLKTQNANLLAKVQTCAAQHKETRCSGGVQQGNVIFQERNKVLSEQLLKSLDRYRSSKRRLKEAQEESAIINVKIEEMGHKIGAGLDRIRNLSGQQQPPDDIQNEISALKHMFECFKMKVSKDATTDVIKATYVGVYSCVNLETNFVDLK